MNTTALYGGANALTAALHGHGPGGRGHHDGFVPHPMMDPNVHHGLSWPWFLLLLILGITALVFLVRWVRRKSKANHVQQFIDTSLSTTHHSIPNQAAIVLDRWETNYNQKEKNDHGNF